MRDHTAMHADDLYELVSDRAGDGKPPIRTSNGAPRDGRNLFPYHVVAESPQDLLINTSQGRGLAGSGSASLGAGYHQPDVALAVDALVVTAASRPRGTARPGSTPRDLPALCAVKAHHEAAQQTPGHAAAY